MTFSSLFGSRLKEARKALGWNQAQAAEISGVSREHWGRCERGIAVPGGEVLAALAAHGFDVLYVLSGESEQPKMPKLAPDEQILLDSYRDASPTLRKAALAALLSGGGVGSNIQSAVGNDAIQIGNVTGKARIKNR